MRNTSVGEHITHPRSPSKIPKKDREEHLSQQTLGPRKSLFKEFGTISQSAKGEAERRQQEARYCIPPLYPSKLRSTGGGPDRADTGGLHGFPCQTHGR